MRLNVGSGGQVAEGWLHLDRAFTPETIAKANDLDAELRVIELTDLPLPFPDASATMAVAHHSLCMFAEDDLRNLLAEVYRVLEPGGMLRVSIVDYERAIKALVQRDRGWFHSLGVPALDTTTDHFLWYLDWGGARKTILYSPAHLAREFLEPAGFTCESVAFHETTTFPSITVFDSRPDESWFLEARRPA